VVLSPLYSFQPFLPHRRVGPGVGIVLLVPTCFRFRRRAGWQSSRGRLDVLIRRLGVWGRRLGILRRDKGTVSFSRPWSMPLAERILPRPPSLCRLFSVLFLLRSRKRMGVIDVSAACSGAVLLVEQSAPALLTFFLFLFRLWMPFDAVCGAGRPTA
jgi:hypothetical protein